MKHITNVLLIFFLMPIVQSCSNKDIDNRYIKYESVRLNSEERKIVEKILDELHEKFDPKENMITKTLGGYNYHTDADSGVFHEVRGSFYYAALLLDLADDQYTDRAFNIIEKTITLQDQDTTSKSVGVWPYYLEEPLSTKKSPIDYNWADFNAVSLLDVWMGHQDRIPSDLKPKIKDALILAAKSIQKRNMRPGYTNIAIMGAYVTYMTSNLFNLPEMSEYASGRLKRFYDYTLEKGGFSEYNSPTYTIVALDELFRMKLHIIEPTARQQVDSLYSIGWEIIARHYHKPTGQWAGPHSRSYSTLVQPTFYSILKEGSNGQIDVGIEQKRKNVKIKHQIPLYLMPYFLSPEYPRTEKDVFEKENPQTIGTSYLTDKYALSTANRSSLWNQRRPFLLYWGQVQKPKYLQVRFLHDNYDFSSSTFYSEQEQNKILAGINFISNGGDKHISIDRLKEGKFIAKDLRLRFEFGNMNEQDKLVLPKSVNDLIKINLDQINLNMQLYSAQFDEFTGSWGKGGDDTNCWIDLVFYSGVEKEFDLTKIDKAFAGFIFEVNTTGDRQENREVEIAETDGVLNIEWKGLKLETPVKPQSPENTFI